MSRRADLTILGSIVAILAIMAVPGAVAHPHPESVTITAINEEISLKETVTTMHVPADNMLPWGTVKGPASDYVERYPVIIQFYQHEEPVHVAQVDAKGDGSYEYKFRVKNMDAETGEYVNIFEGDYTVKIFRVVPNEDAQA